MSLAYIYKAEIYCERCGEAAQAEFGIPLSKASEDSWEFPQGPFTNGGGESDTPQHCACCSKFLGNPLTPEGKDVIAQAIIEHYHDNNPFDSVLAEYQAHYGIYPVVDGHEIQL